MVDDYIRFGQTFESEYEYEYDPYEAVLTRRATNVVARVDTTATRDATYHRDASNHVAQVDTFAGGRFVILRDASNTISSIDNEASRVVTIKRDSLNVVGQIDSESGVVFENWRITGEVQLEQLIREIRTWDGIDFTFEVRETVAQALRDFGDHAGKYEIINRSSGGFGAYDRAGGANTYDISPPDNRADLRVVESWLVEDFNLRPLDQIAHDYELVLRLVAESNVEPEPGQHPTHSDDPDLWLFELAAGDILSRRVSYDTPTGGNKVDSRRVTVLLSADEQLIIERSATRQAGVVVQEIEDGEDFARDESTDAVNTVDISPPDNSSVAFEADTYIITDWEAEWLNDDWYQTTITLLRTPNS